MKLSEEEKKLLDTDGSSKRTVSLSLDSNVVDVIETYRKEQSLKRSTAYELLLRGSLQRDDGEATVQQIVKELGALQRRLARKVAT